MSDNTTQLNVPDNIKNDSQETYVPSVKLNIVSGLSSSILSDMVNNVEQNVVSKLNLEKYLTFIIDPKIRDIVTLLTNNSTAVQDVINMINLILADGKVDMQDGPILLSLFKKIITLRGSDLNLTKELSISHFIDIIKLVITILTKENLIKVDNPDEFLADITKLVNLIKTGEKIIESMSCCSCFGKK